MAGARGGLSFAGGIGPEALTEESACLVVSFGLWGLGSLFLTPSAMAGLRDDRACMGPVTAPLGIPLWWPGRADERRRPSPQELRKHSSSTKAAR